MEKKRGGQPGNNNAGVGRQARRALEIAIRNNGQKKEVASDIECLVEIWNKAIEQAKEGNSGSISMIMDRLDGKPGQSIEHTGEILTKHRELTEKESDALNTTLNDDF